MIVNWDLNKFDNGWVNMVKYVDGVIFSSAALPPNRSNIGVNELIKQTQMIPFKTKDNRYSHYDNKNNRPCPKMPNSP